MMLRNGTLALVLLGAGCGDDEGTSGAGGGGTSSGSTTASATTSGSTSSSSGDGGAGAAGGGGQGGQGGSGVGGAGGGGAGAGALGAPCLEDDDCEDGLCLTELASGHPGGSCARRCDPAAVEESCPEGQCETRGGFGSVCIPACDPAAPACRDAHQCRPASSQATFWACRPDCDEDADCPSTGNCTEYPDFGVCRPSESVCDDLRDVPDDDRLYDCADPDCADDPICAGGPGALGDPCESHLDCAAGTLCMDEARMGWPHGMCVAGADGTGTCPEGFFRRQTYTLAVTFVEVCVPACDGPSDCRPGYECNGFCQARCSDDDQCASGSCNPGDRLCHPVEICDDGIDNDSTYFEADCEDPACFDACEGALTEACAEATELPEEGTFTSTTGQQAVCGGPGAAPTVFRFVAPASGELAVTLVADTPHWLGLGRECEGQEIDCSLSGPFPGDAVTRSRSVGAGQELFVTVAADAAELVGEFSLTSAFTPN